MKMLNEMFYLLKRLRCDRLLDNWRCFTGHRLKRVYSKMSTVITPLTLKPRILVRPPKVSLLWAEKTYKLHKKASTLAFKLTRKREYTFPWNIALLGLLGQSHNRDILYVQANGSDGVWPSGTQLYQNGCTESDAFSWKHPYRNIRFFTAFCHPCHLAFSKT